MKILVVAISAVTMFVTPAVAQKSASGAPKRTKEYCQKYNLRPAGPGAPGYNAQMREAAARDGCKAQGLSIGGSRPL